MNTHKDTTNLEVLDEQLNSEESNYGIMFAKGYKYLDQFNVALQVLNNDGSYQKIKEQWIKTKEQENRKDGPMKIMFVFSFIQIKFRV